MLRCFPEVSPNSAHVSHSIIYWMSQFSKARLGLSPIQQGSMAQLIPLLLCGEQSALFVFHKESTRLSNAPSIEALNTIEADESLHEMALQMLLSVLPVVESHRTKRLAQKFYASIEKRTHSIAEHFLAISQLDACVCVIMNAIVNSSIKETYTAQLFNLIKRDEARHVKIAKSHAVLLNSHVSFGKDFCIHQELVTLLTTQKKAFEELDVDFSKLSLRLMDLRKE